MTYSACSDRESVQTSRRRELRGKDVSCRHPSKESGSGYPGAGQKGPQSKGNTPGWTRTSRTEQSPSATKTLRYQWPRHLTIKGMRGHALEKRAWRKLGNALKCTETKMRRGRSQSSVKAEAQQGCSVRRGPRGGPSAPQRDSREQTEPRLAEGRRGGAEREAIYLWNSNFL